MRKITRSACRLNVMYSPAVLESEARPYAFPSFDAYFEPFDRGAGAIGAEYAGLPEGVRRTVREE